MPLRVPLAISALAFVLAVSASGQISGAPASVTSYGFGGHQTPNAPRASVTSLGPNGYGTPPLQRYQGPPRFTTGPVGPNGGHPHRPNHPHYPYYPYYYPYYPVIDPYVYSAPVDTAPAVEDEDQYQGGPTIFDRRGSGQLYPNEYGRKPLADSSPTGSATANSSQADGPPESPQPPTILVFKDGHKLEVTNYAIVGANLFDLSSDHRQKIPLADLDVAATQKANEEQGIDFKLPKLPVGS